MNYFNRFKIRLPQVILKGGDMKKWNKENAISELRELIDEIPKLAGQRRFSGPHSEWLMRTLSISEDVFGMNSRYYRTIASLRWQNTGTMLAGGLLDPDGPDIAASIERQHQEAYKQQLDTAMGILRASLKELERATDIDSLYMGKDTPPESSQLIRIINLAEFKLRKVIHNTPSNEKQIQEGFESLLVGADIPYSRESERIEYSSKTYQPDFTFEKIGLAIDVKFCAREGREKEIISEINDDVLAYQTKYPNVLFVVYDTGYIRDVDRFAASFEEHGKVIVRVVKH